ncbi:glycerol-3-phosphate dehydrogenase/oxidase [Calidifontibacter terrae]
MIQPGILNAATRRTALQELRTETFDLIVIGGGVTGAGVALDAASRGLRTALVEQVDLAAGTSRWSSKLAHGGLRYIAQGRLGIAVESARERQLLMTTIAPHLVRPASNVLPLTADVSAFAGVAAQAGIGVADLLRRAAHTSAGQLPPPRRVGAERAHALAPAVRTDGLRGAITFWDGQFEDDARFVVALARTAAAQGARIATHASAEIVDDHTLRLTDHLGGEEFVARAQVVVNATGVWADQLDDRIRLRPSRGTHLVVESACLANQTSIVNLPVPGKFGRYVFTIPAPDGLTYIGLTDEDAPGADGHAPEVPEKDVAFLLGVVNRRLAQPLSASDVVGSFAGLRPLVDGHGASSDVSRAHLLVDEPGRPLVIVGGKFTTYRLMAQQTVDAAARRMPSNVRPGLTHLLPLIGAASATALAGLAAPARLVRRYGKEALAVTALVAQRPELADRVVPESATTRAELVHAIRAEGALTVEDLIERRSRLTLRAAARGPAEQVAAELLATESVEGPTLFDRT